MVPFKDRRSSILLVLLTLFGNGFIQVAKCCETEDQLYEELFITRKYRMSSRPVVHVTDVVTVHLGLVIEKIVELNELQEVLKANVWHRIKWNDYRLAWNSSEYGGLEILNVPANNLWLPDILKANNAKDDAGKVGKSDHLETKIVRITSDGNCTWFPTSLSVTHCPVEVGRFPFDEQYCQMTYELWGHDSSHVQLDFYEPSVDRENYQKNGEWDMLDVTPSKMWIRYPCCKEPYAHLIFMIHLRRKSLYYVYNFVIPCGVFSLISLATFLLQPGCGERIGLSVTLLLGLSVYQTMINTKLPVTSDSLPLLGVYYQFVMIMKVMSIIMSIVVIALNNNTTTVVMPPAVERIVCTRLAVLLGVKRKSNSSPLNWNRVDSLLRRELHRKSETPTTGEVRGDADEDIAVKRCSIVDLDTCETCRCSKVDEELIKRVIDVLRRKTDKNCLKGSSDVVRLTKTASRTPLMSSMCYVIRLTKTASRTLPTSSRMVTGCWRLAWLTESVSFCFLCVSLSERRPSCC